MVIRMIYFLIFISLAVAFGIFKYQQHRKNKMLNLLIESYNNEGIELKKLPLAFEETTNFDDILKEKLQQQNAEKEVKR